jgi:hypothetical protein
MWRQLQNQWSDSAQDVVKSAAQAKIARSARREFDIAGEVSTSDDGSVRRNNTIQGPDAPACKFPLHDDLL